MTEGNGKSASESYPAGWELVRLSDVVTPSAEKVDPIIFHGSKYIGLEHIESGTKRITGAGNAVDVKSTKAVFRAGDVLYGKLRPYLNKVCQPDFDGVCSTDILVFQESTGLDNRYLLHFLSRPSTVEYATQNSSGINLPRVGARALGEIDFPVPPLPEQRRIVKKIESLQERSRRAREALDEVGPLLEQFRQSLLAAAFRGDLTADWRAANPNVEPASELLNRIRQDRRQKWEQAEHAKYEAKGRKPPKGWQEKFQKPICSSAAPSFELPDGWVWTNVETVSQWVKDGTHWPPKTTDRGIPFIGIRNVIDGRINWATVDKWVSEETYAELTAKYPHRPGDVLYTAVGATFGRAFPIEDDRKFIFQRHIAHIRPLPGVSASYLISALNSPNGFNQAKRLARGAAQPTVTLGDLKGICIPLCPSDEQDEIVKRIGDAFTMLNSIRAAVAESKSDLLRLDQSILAKAFRGELVPQDPCDEPAAELLRRIAEQRSKHPGSKGRTKARSGKD